MSLSTRDREVLRQLAERYSEIAHLDVQKQRIERYRRTNALEPVRPVVLIDEVPWGEIKDPELTNVCAPELGWIETPLRQTLYQWKHFQADRVVPPVFQVTKQTRWLRGYGLDVKDRQIQGDTGAYITAHAYTDQLSTEEDLAKLQAPEFVYDPVHGLRGMGFGVTSSLFTLSTYTVRKSLHARALLRSFLTSVKCSE